MTSRDLGDLPQPPRPQGESKTAATVESFHTSERTLL